MAEIAEGGGVDQKDAIWHAYAFYDSDDRVHGPDDFEAFTDAVNRALGGEEFEDAPVADAGKVQE